MTFNPGQLLKAQQLNEEIAAGGIVRSVAGRTGNIILTVTDVADAAPILSPLFTGEPRGPTAAPDTNTVQLATTAFVLAQGASANPVVNGAAAPGSATRFSRADHVHPTDTSRLATAGGSMAGALLVIAGLANAPGLGFVGDATTGLYSSAAGTLNITTAGANRLGINSTGLTPTVPLLAPSGSASAPSLSFSSDSDTGLYRSATNQIAIAAGGLDRAVFQEYDHTISARAVAIDGQVVGPTPGGVSNAELRLKPGLDQGAILSFWSRPIDTNSEVRWWLYTGNVGSDLDDTTNVGSDLTLRSWADAGTALRDHVVFQRSTGTTRFSVQGTTGAPTIALGPNSTLGINYSAANTMDFHSNSATRMTLTNALLTLNVPISMSHNSASGGIALTIAGAGTALDVQQTGTGKGIIVTCAGATAGDPFTVEDSTRPDSTPFIIKNDGKVGIGLTAPASELDLVGNMTLTGTIVGSAAAPTVNGQLANKLYVDTMFAAAGGFPAGTRMAFQQTAAPTGWTKDTTHDNKALRLVSGTVGTGGSVNFTTAFASQAVSGTVNNTTLTTAQMPSHAHGYLDRINAGGGEANVNGTSSGGSDISRGTDAAGSDGSHNHSFTGTAINLAVQYVDFIIASKN